jgi:cell division protein FtsL
LPTASVKVEVGFNEEVSVSRSLPFGRFENFLFVVVIVVITAIVIALVFVWTKSELREVLKIEEGL